jgi:hypothetical protein
MAGVGSRGCQLRPGRACRRVCFRALRAGRRRRRHRRAPRRCKQDHGVLHKIHASGRVEVSEAVVAVPSAPDGESCSMPSEQVGGGIGGGGPGVEGVDVAAEGVAEGTVAVVGCPEQGGGGGSGHADGNAPPANTRGYVVDAAGQHGQAAGLQSPSRRPRWLSALPGEGTQGDLGPQTGAVPASHAACQARGEHGQRPRPYHGLEPIENRENAD